MSLGLGAMLRMLGGNEGTVDAIRRAKDKRIVETEIRNGHALLLSFEDGSKLRLEDKGQSCCERRWMSCDDDLGGFVGADFLGAEIRHSRCFRRPPRRDDVQFLVIHTTKGEIVCQNHNEHNGYYGGFSIEASLEPAAENSIDASGK